MVVVTNKLYQSINIGVNGSIQRIPPKSSVTLNLKEASSQIKDLAKENKITYKELG